ncbi:nuclear transport factor 2 family protein [Mycobacterium sp. ITM-2016-00317]|uniref:nuclear transport factor 2 family protein n=1 Tax=Mycobacterium sp. ITM-2016-00317 TaxID=2099694 RepID=UPI00287FED04|nr:nuclear transport factor 2 family protein [Mycobacterium sp. ITM-2016-00317]WNG89118.1 nuclear transport factor 2 family protein [Mycobacterium sp. ITM-2016-00317]
MTSEPEALETRLRRMEQRLQALEDEREIARLIASYGPSVDAADAVAAAALWSADGTYDVEGWHMSGRDDVAAMVDSDHHRHLVANGCAHFLGPAVVTVRGDDAVAVCESLVVLRADDGYPQREPRATRDGVPGPEYVVWRAAANHFRLCRVDGRWKVAARTSRLLDGRPAAHELLTAGVAGRTV